MFCFRLSGAASFHPPTSLFFQFYLVILTTFAVALHSRGAGGRGGTKLCSLMRKRTPPAPPKKNPNLCGTVKKATPRYSWSNFPSHSRVMPSASAAKQGRQQERKAFYLISEMDGCCVYLRGDFVFSTSDVVDSPVPPSGDRYRGHCRGGGFRSAWLLLWCLGQDTVTVTENNVCFCVLSVGRMALSFAGSLLTSTSRTTTTGT